MAQPPLHSAILATYNGRRYLRECIESVLAQRHANFEFIIVDDGSTDGSDDIIREYAAREPRRIKSLRLEQNSGQAEGFNRGIGLAQGELVSFLDSDDLWYADKLTTVAAQFGDPAVVAMHQHNLDLLRPGGVKEGTFRPNFVVGDLLAETIRTRVLPTFVATTGLTFSRRALAQVLPIPRAFRVCADGFLTRTAMCYGRLSATDACLGAYRVHESNATFENPGFNQQRYVQELLFPHLNEFYAARQIGITFRPEPPREPAIPASAMGLRALRIAPGERVLVLRSAQPDRVRAVLAALFVAAPGVLVDLLVQTGFEESFQDPRITLGPLPAGLLPPDPLPEPVRQFIAGRTYVACLVPYSDGAGRGYDNVHAALRLSDLGCPLIGVGSRGALFPFG